MDKYEYEIKTEQIRKLILLKEYDTAKKIADGMKWGKEKNPRLLSEVAELYVMSGEYDDAIDLLLQAYDYAHPGRLILKRLVEVAIMAKNYRNAAEYCEEFHDLNFGHLVCMVNGETTPVPLSEIAGKLKVIEPDCSMIREAKAMGICFGD